MTQTLLRRRSISLFVLLMFLLGACTDLAGQPEIIATLTPANTAIPTVADQGYPADAPDVVNGARIFAENCTACHGVNGDGNGELVQAGSVPQMPSFLDDSHVSALSPAEYFETITNGRIENMMPPWADALTEQQRWDVAHYVYTLHYSAEQLTTGAEIYGTYCTECHDDQGTGQGTEMTETFRSAGDLTDLQNIPFISDQAIMTSIDEGIGDDMPALGDDLTEEQITAVTAYLRTFTVPSLGADTTDSLSVAQSAGDTVSITGTVTNQTADAPTTAGLTVELRYGNEADGISQATTITGTDGTFTFDDVPVNPLYEYLTLTFYSNRLFISDVLTGDQLTNPADMPLTIYELTEDPFVITISNIDMVIEPFRVEDVGTGLLITETITYTNTSDRLFSTSQAIGNGTFATLLIELPPGSIPLNTRANPRFIVIEDQYAIIDTDPLEPGDNPLELVYFVPYATGATIDRPLNNRLDGTVEITVESPRLRVISDDLQPVESDDDSRTVYTGQPTLDERNTLQFDVTGRLFASENTSADGNIITSDALIPALIIIGLVIVLVGVGFFLSTRGKSLDRDIDQLVRRIAELDQLHDQGHINHDVYRRQRADLKAELAQLMQTPKSAEDMPDEST